MVQVLKNLVSCFCTGWETVTIDLSVDKGGNAVDAGEYELIVLFSNYGNGAHKKSDTRYFDNLTYTDGAVIPGDPSPATAAPTPTHNAADVLNVFSDHYANSLDWSVNEIRAGWSNGGETAVIDFAADDKMVKQNLQTTLVHTGTVVALHLMALSIFLGTQILTLMFGFQNLQLTQP